MAMLLRPPARRVHLLRPHHLCRALSSAAAAAALPSFTPTRPPTPTEWTSVPVSSVRPASSDATVYHVSLDLSSHPSLVASHVAAGQDLPFRFPGHYPVFLAIASPPPASVPPRFLRTSFHFLVNLIKSTANEDLIRRRRKRVSVGTSAVGRGFEVSRIADAREVLIFAYGTGISPIRSLIESGFGENENIDVTLFYGALHRERMAYQEMFSHWESSGIEVIPVFDTEDSEDSEWNGQRGYALQEAYRRTKKVVNPSSAGAILCGRKEMYEEVAKALVADGLSEDRILTNLWRPLEHISGPSGCGTLTTRI